MNKNPSDKWYLKTSFLVIAFLVVGPLALPLFWINPRFSKKGKIIISIIVLILSYLLWILFSFSLKYVSANYRA